MNKNEHKQMMVFGYGLPLICFFLSWRQHHINGDLAWVKFFLFTGSLMLFVTLFVPPLLKVIFECWMKGVRAIGSVVTTVILSVFYFIVITPFSIALRLLRKDYMQMRSLNSSNTFWKKRINNQQDYTRQF